MGVVRTGEIKALTGLRIVAAMWVVLFHFRPLIWEASPRLKDDLAPLLNSGAQGVDLFFILSGFVLTWNYLERMGPHWSTRATPALPVVAAVPGVADLPGHHAHRGAVDHLHAARRHHAVGGRREAHRHQLRRASCSWCSSGSNRSSTAPAGTGRPGRSARNGWPTCCSAVIILVIFRMARVTRARTLLLLAFVASLPPTILLLASGHFYTPWSWLPRIVAQFLAGALACAAVRRLQPDRAKPAHRRLRRDCCSPPRSSRILYYYDAHPVPA